MEHAKVNGIELAYEVVGSGEPMLFIHGAHLADALKPLVTEPVLEHFKRIRYQRRASVGANARLRQGRRASPRRPRTPCDYSATSAWIAPTWWATPGEERSPWSSPLNTPRGWRRWCCSNRHCR